MEINQNPSPEDLGVLIDRAKANPLHQTAPVEDKCDRLTGRIAFSLQSCEFDPTYINTTFMQRLKNQEQPWDRQMKVKQTAQVLGIGWLESVGYVIIQNKRKLPANASTEERELHERHRIIISIDGIPVFGVRPGHCFVAELLTKGSAERVSLSSNEGDALASITVLPE